MTEETVRRAVLVTGASAGLGRATATVFAADGAAVVGIARRADLGRALEHEIHASGGELVFVPGDVRKPADCQRAVATAIDRYGRLDVLVNCAGVRTIPHFIPTHRVSEAEWDDVMDTNVKGTFFCCSAALEHMKRQGDGVIINISSKNAIRATAGLAAYCTSKAAVLHLSRTLAVEYAGHNVRVFAVTLSGVHTDMATAGGLELRRLAGDEQAVAPDPAALTEMLLSPERVARTFLWLCDERAGSVLGAVVPIEGGISAAMESGGSYGSIDVAALLDRLDARG
jgi:NAD(P)-dependent dehydrogenase (short-subunit alcohol dehydrogenase family)